MMRNTWALTQRELQATFYSPIAYIVAAVFLIATGYLFMENTLKPGEEASVRMLLQGMAWMLVFAVPLLTMRSLSEEYTVGTIETLMTAPVTDVEVVIGKFLGAFVFFLTLLAATLVYVVILLRYGAADLSVIAWGYCGMLFLGAMYVAVGIFASSLTRYQLLAALFGAGLLGVFTLLVDALAVIQGGAWRTVFGYINILYRFEDFTKGMFDTRGLVFFISGTLFFLFLTVKVLESRRWR